MDQIDITSLEFDSRRVLPGAMFFAIKGEHFDGHAFIEQAISKGARAVVAERVLSINIPFIVTPDVRKAMGIIAHRFFGPFNDMVMVGITGTNGKTTTAFLLHAILDKAGLNPGLLGTIWYVIGDQRIAAQRTTPESLDIFRMLAMAKQHGAEAMVMEVSSHALSLSRVNEVLFDTTIFTNFTQDHLDFHRSLEDYKEAKLRIFSLLKKNGYAIVNRDDPVYSDIERLSLPYRVTYGIEQSSDFRGTILSDTLHGLEVEVAWHGHTQRLRSGLIGSYNAYNILAAFATSIILNIKVMDIVDGVATLNAVRGRLEKVVENVFVDYAHTPDAIKHALAALRQYCQGHLIIVFGCGGDRDREKRPQMGAIASSLADQVILTSDNPRSEDPAAIIRAIEKGVTRDNYTIIQDRRDAIAHALKQRKPDDIVLIAGKGHETYQIIQDERRTFDDAEVVRQCTMNS